MSSEFYRNAIEEALSLAVEEMGEKNGLRDACEYALMSGGKRLRPIIVLMIAEALGFDLDVLPAALSVEFFHTASLIADDLPCMDDDDERRGAPSLHKAFGENVAILTSYTLIAAGYGGISENARRMEKKGHFGAKAQEVALLSLTETTKCAGINGATHGQFLDLYHSHADFATFQKIVQLKTSSLFGISFLYGWLFGGGDPRAVNRLKKCGSHLGMAFQIADDLDDESQDTEHLNPMNIAVLCGKEKALSLFEKEILSFRRELEELGLWTPSFQSLFLTLDRRKHLPAHFFI